MISDLELRVKENNVFLFVDIIHRFGPRNAQRDLLLIVFASVKY